MFVILPLNKKNIAMCKVNIRKLNQDEILQLGIKNWPVWEKEVSRFDWKYDENEHCLILEGEVVVETNLRAFTIKAGDFVTFEKGLECTWDIIKPVKKHYCFH